MLSRDTGPQLLGCMVSLNAQEQPSTLSLQSNVQTHQDVTPDHSPLGAVHRFHPLAGLAGKALDVQLANPFARIVCVSSMHCQIIVKLQTGRKQSSDIERYERVHCVQEHNKIKDDRNISKIE